MKKFFKNLFFTLFYCHIVVWSIGLLGYVDPRIHENPGTYLFSTEIIACSISGIIFCVVSLATTDFG